MTKPTTKRHRRIGRGASLLAAGAIVSAFALQPAVASADEGNENRSKRERYEFDLAPVPHDSDAAEGSNVEGVGRLVLRGDQLQAKFRFTGLSPMLPHVMHIHGDVQAQNECPGPDHRDDRVDDGLIDTVEGLSDYGPIVVSFTNTGDTSAASGLAIDRFNSANGHGNLRYNRSFAIPQAIAENLDGLHVVIHGLDLNGNGMYDGPDGSLGAGVPLEAELPVACGPIGNGSKPNRH